MFIFDKPIFKRKWTTPLSLITIHKVYKFALKYCVTNFIYTGSGGVDASVCVWLQFSLRFREVPIKCHTV